MAKIEIDTVTLPASWASALVNGDYSGLDDRYPAEGFRCRGTVAQYAALGWHIASCSGEEWFTWNYQIFDPGADCKGGNVIDYIILQEANQPSGV